MGNDNVLRFGEATLAGYKSIPTDEVLASYCEACETSFYYTQEEIKLLFAFKSSLSIGCPRGHVLVWSKYLNRS